MKCGFGFPAFMNCHKTLLANRSVWPDFTVFFRYFPRLNNYWKEMKDIGALWLFCKPASLLTHRKMQQWSMLCKAWIFKQPRIHHHFLLCSLLSVWKGNELAKALPWRSTGRTGLFINAQVVFIGVALPLAKDEFQRAGVLSLNETFMDCSLKRSKWRTFRLHFWSLALWSFPVTAAIIQETAFSFTPLHSDSCLK